MHVTGRLKKGLYMEFCDIKKAFLIYLPNLHKSYTFWVYYIELSPLTYEGQLP